MSETNPEAATDVKVAYFAASANITREIDEWARRSGKRILAVVPVYWEDVAHG